MTDKQESQLGPLSLCLNQSIGTASWLTPSDGAALGLAIQLAAVLDVSIAAGELSLVPQLSARYLAALQQLHLTVETRVASKQGEEQDGTAYVGDYLRLVNTTASESKARSTKRRASGQQSG